MLQRTLSTLVTLAKRRARRENDDTITDGEWKSLLSDAFGEMHGFVSETGCREFETEASITANGTATGYALPTDWMSTIGVDFVVDSAGRRRPLEEGMIQERPWLMGQTGEAYAFALEGQNLVLFPNAQNGTYKHLYLPQPTDYSSSADSTTVNVINTFGLRFIVWSAAADALHEGEEIQADALKRRDEARMALIGWATQRALVNPRRTVVRGMDAMSELADIHGLWNPASWRYR